MDQDATCNGGRPRPRPYCVKWGTQRPEKRALTSPPIFGPLGTKVDLGPGRHCVRLLDRDPTSLPKGDTSPPIFAHVLWPNGCILIHAAVWPQYMGKNWGCCVPFLCQKLSQSNCVCKNYCKLSKWDVFETQCIEH